MRRIWTLIGCAAWLLATLILVTGTSQPEGRAALGPAGSTSTDPFQYCGVVGTIDAPDARYVGPKVPLVIAQGLQKAFGIPASAPLEPFLRNSYWRCMDGKVFACTVGANLPCLEKANTSRTPASGMTEYCKTNPNADNIPAYVTGRATVYLWRCHTGKPAIVRQVTKPDGRGFLSNVWYQIEPGATQ